MALRMKSLEVGWESADVADLQCADYPDRRRGMWGRSPSRVLGPRLLQENSEEEVGAGWSIH